MRLDYVIYVLQSTLFCAEIFKANLTMPTDQKLQLKGELQFVKEASTNGRRLLISIIL